MRFSMCQLSLIVAAMAACVIPARAGDLRDGVPSNTYLATYHRHNPERDYQKPYFDNVWATIEDTQICERFLQAIENQLDGDELEKFEDIRETLADALEPVQWEALAQCTESVYAQRMTPPASQHLVLLRLPEGAAAGFAEGITNLFELAAGASEGRVPLVRQDIDGVELRSLQVPPQVPFSPSVAALDDVFLFSSRQDFAAESIRMLKDPSAESKFDDPRLAEALQNLPEFEDGLTFFDGREMFSQMRGIATFIRQVSGGNADAERVAKLVDEIFSQIDIFDYEVTVEYTEGYQNRAAVFGRILPGYQDKVIGQMFADRQLFEDWSRWVPADATAYSLTTGATVRPLYVWLMELIPAHFPRGTAGSGSLRPTPGSIRSAPG